MLHNSFVRIQRALRKKNIHAVALVGIVFGIILLGVAYSARANIFGDLYNEITRGLSAPTSSVQTSPPSVAPSAPVADYEAAVTGAVEHTTDAVVSIVVSKDLPVIEQCPYNPFSDLPPDVQQFFGGGNFQFSQPCQKGTKKQEVGGGSGFIVSSDGLIVTNKHVVADTKADYTVLTNNGKKYDATVLARHPSLDIALVKISARGLATVSLGDSDHLKLGQTAIAIGNALGEFRNTVSVGVISGLARNITASDGGGNVESIENVIQTDAAINPGNSGGPLLDVYGNVVGINVATVSGAQNIGFAIPINVAKKSIQSVQTSGKIEVPYLGVRYISITDAIAEQYSLSVTSGALLKGSDKDFAVINGSPAQKAGLKEGDVIVSVGGVAIDSSHSLGYLIAQHSVGESVVLHILRDGNTLDVSVTLSSQE